jgi:hypothetical protein
LEHGVISCKANATGSQLRRNPPGLYIEVVLSGASGKDPAFWWILSANCHQELRGRSTLGIEIRGQLPFSFLGISWNDLVLLQPAQIDSNPIYFLNPLGDLSGIPCRTGSWLHDAIQGLNREPTRRANQARLRNF